MNTSLNVSDEEAKLADKIVRKALYNSIKDKQDAPYYLYETQDILDDLDLMKYYQKGHKNNFEEKDNEGDEWKNNS